MQDAGTNLSSVAATVSLLVLIVVELASFARNEIDGPREVVGAPTLFRMSELNWWPSLGRVVVVHVLNLFILAVATFLVFSVSGEPVSVALLIIVLLVALVLPILEIGQYQAIGEARFPLSLVYNSLAVMIFTVLGFLLSYDVIQFFSVSLDSIVNFHMEPTDAFSEQSVGVAMIALVVVTLVFDTLIQLEYELKEIAESDSTTVSDNRVRYT